MYDQGQVPLEYRSIVLPTELTLPGHTIKYHKFKHYFITALHISVSIIICILYQSHEISILTA